jgi:hypothetical protein
MYYTFLICWISSLFLGGGTKLVHWIYDWILFEHKNKKKVDD